MSPLSESKKASNKKWNDANMKTRYDRIQLVVPKGTKKEWQASAKKLGLTLNKFIFNCVDFTITEMDD